MARAYVAASSQHSSRTGPPATTLPITVSLWFNTTSIGGVNASYPISQSTTSGGYAMMAITQTGDPPAGRVRAESYDGVTGVTARTTTVCTAGTWNHAATIFQQNSRTAYLNGGGKNTESTALTSYSVTNNFSIARFDNGVTQSNYYDGSIAEVGIWNVVLDDDEIAALAKGVAPTLIRPGSLMAYYPLLDSASPELDRWNGGFNLTPGGSPTMADHTRMYYPRGGVNAIFAGVTYTLVLDAGAYAVSGIAAVLREGHRLILAVGSYAVTGVALRMEHGYHLVLAQGSYLVTGIATSLRKGARALRRAIGTYITTRYLRGTVERND